MNFSLRDGGSLVVFVVLLSFTDGMPVLSLRGMPYCRYSSYFLVLGILVVLPYGRTLSRNSAPCIVMFEIGLAGTVYGGGQVRSDFSSAWKGEFGDFPGF